MIESVLSQAMAAGAGTATTPTPIAPGASDLERFQLALNSMPPSSSQPSPPVLTTTAPVDAAAAQPSAIAAGSSAAPNARKTLGDAILSGLQSASNDLSQSWQGASEALSKQDLSVSDVLRWQQVLLQSSMQYELLGKVISKSTQNLDHVLKTQ